MASAYFKQEPDDISSLFHTLSPEPYLSTKRKREDLDSKEDAKPRKRPTISYRECLTCCTDKPLNQYPKLKHAAAHASDVCRKCWSQHLGTQITDKDASSVQCVQCEHKLTEPEIRKLCNSGAYQRYLDKAAQSFMKADEEYRACPSADRAWGAFFAREDGNIFTCQSCRLRWCLVCDVAFHEGQTCEEYAAQRRAEGEASQRRQDENRKSQKFMAKETKPCTGCRASILKNGGCNHMTCKRCKHEFCWVCLAYYNGPQGIRRTGNGAHLYSCSFTPARLPNLRANFQV